VKINPNIINNPPHTNNKNTKNQEKSKEIPIEKESQYIPNQGEEKKVTYDNPKVNQTEVKRLKEESDRAHSGLRRMVEELLKRQGMTFNDLELGKEVIVDEIARSEAQALIGEGGDLSPEKVSDRIVEFAKAISGGDKGKFEILKSAIEEGFKQAAEVLGGELPEISQKTYDLVMEKLNYWKEEEQ